jgi:hypothetical protein
MNIQVVKVSLIIFKKKILTAPEIRDGLNAFTLTAKEKGSEHIPINVDEILKSMRLINKVISPIKIE